MKKKLLLLSGLLTVSGTCLGDDESMRFRIATWIASKGLVLGIVGLSLREAFGPKSGFWSNNPSVNGNQTTSSFMIGQNPAVTSTTNIFHSSRVETEVTSTSAASSQTARVDTVVVAAASEEIAVSSAPVENSPADTRSLRQQAAETIEGISQAAHDAAQKVNRGVKTTIDVVTWPYKKAVQAKDFCFNPEYRPYFAAAGTFVGTMALLDLRHERACIGDYTRDVGFSFIVAGAIGYVVHQNKHNMIRIKDMEAKLEELDRKNEERYQIQERAAETRYKQLQEENKRLREEQFKAQRLLVAADAAAFARHQESLRATEALATTVAANHTEANKNFAFVNTAINEGFNTVEKRDKEARKQRDALEVLHHQELSDKVDATKTEVTGLAAIIKTLQSEVKEGIAAAEKAANNTEEIKHMLKQSKQQEVTQSFVLSPTKSASTAASPGKGNGPSFHLSGIDFSQLGLSTGGQNRIRSLPTRSVVE